MRPVVNIESVHNLDELSPEYVHAHLRGFVQWAEVDIAFGQIDVIAVQGNWHPGRMSFDEWLSTETDRLEAATR